MTLACRWATCRRWCRSRRSAPDLGPAFSSWLTDYVKNEFPDQMAT